MQTDLAGQRPRRQSAADFSDDSYRAAQNVPAGDGIHRACRGKRLEHHAAAYAFAQDRGLFLFRPWAEHRVAFSRARRSHAAYLRAEPAGSALAELVDSLRMWHGRIQV